MWLHSWFSLIWYATLTCSEKVELWPTDLIPRVWGRWRSAGKMFATMLLHSWVSLIWYATLTCSGKVEFWPTDLIPRVWGRGRGRGLQNNCYIVAAFMILFNLICNMTMFWKGWILTPPLTSTPAVRLRPSIENHTWYVSYLLYHCLHVKFP